MNSFSSHSPPRDGRYLWAGPLVPLPPLGAMVAMASCCQQLWAHRWLRPDSSYCLLSCSHWSMPTLLPSQSDRHDFFFFASISSFHRYPPNLWPLTKLPDILCHPYLHIPEPDLPKGGRAPGPTHLNSHVTLPPDPTDPWSALRPATEMPCSSWSYLPLLDSPWSCLLKKNPLTKTSALWLRLCGCVACWIPLLSPPSISSHCICTAFSAHCNTARGSHCSMSDPMRTQSLCPPESPPRTVCVSFASL